MAYVDNYEFMFWFKKVYGERQAKILDDLAKKLDADPQKCVNIECALRFSDSEHSGNGWLPMKRQYRTSWRKEEEK